MSLFNLKTIHIERNARPLPTAVVHQASWLQML